MSTNDREDDNHKRNKAQAIDPGRRTFLKRSVGVAAGLGAAGIGSRFGLINPAYAQKPLGNYPVKGKTVVFGFNPPMTGAYSAEGADELRAYKLAVKHINNGGGMLKTMQPLALEGNGLLGKKVEYVTGDTQTDPDAGRASARRMIERDGVIMFSGSASSAVAIAQQDLAQEKGVIYMAGLTHSNDTTGKNRRRYGFRHYFDADMTGKALGPVLAEEYGGDRRAFHLTADYTWGHSQYQSMKEATEAAGWTTVRNIMTPLGTTDFSQYLTAVLNSDADVLILNHYGNDASNSTTQAARFGLRDREVDGRDFQVVVPMASRYVAEGAGDNFQGILSTGNWNFTLDDPGSKAFTKAFVDEYGFPPAQAGHTAYVQTLLYADAVARAETFYPPEMIKALEDHKVTGIGPGEALYRGCDHQCFHDVTVVQGKAPSEQQNEHDLLRVRKVVKREDIMRACDRFPGELGPYEPV